MELPVSRQTAHGIVDIGVISTDDSQPQFAYSPEYLRNPQRGPLSFSLPLREKPFSEEEFRPYFEGLLPEGPERRALAARLAVREDDYLEILARCGIDCIGDVILNKSAYTETVSYRPVELDKLNTKTGAVNRSALMQSQSRLSLAGTQSKIGLYHAPDAPLSEAWYQPLGGAPSNYIVKFANEELPDLLVVEFLSLACARACGLETAETHLLNPSTPLLCSRRFDRKEAAGGLVEGLSAPLRLHQEDFAQALGLLPASKYAELSPSTANVVADFMQRRFTTPGIARLAFARRALFDYLIGNCDNHLKNLSIVYSESGAVCRLAPAYDIVSTAYFPRFSRQMGMAVGSTRDIDAVRPDDLKLFACQAGVSTRMLRGIAEDFEAHAAPALRDAASSLEEQGFGAAPYIADDLEDEMAPRLSVILAAFA